MLGSTGYIAVIVALALAVYGVTAAVVGVRIRSGALIASAERAAYANFGLLTLANLLMVYALVTHDFSVSYVAQVGSRSTPLLFTVISLWSALEGSILFWGWVLSGYTAAVVWTTRRSPGAARSYAIGTMLGVGAFFYLLLALPANPFGRVFPVPFDGPGPNPLLQNHPLMAVHPPFLYLGYVGFTVPFAFAIGALLAGRLTPEWIRTTRRWAVAAWAFLTIAIIAGMWWSYEVLGWGGYWAWDPVENASFMPWLTATAYMHSTMVEERRGTLRGWNLGLIIATFLLTILGTFLTRSGILSSVHAFSEGPIGYYFLGFIAVVLLFSLALLAGRAGELGSEGDGQGLASRETAFLVNNLVLTAFAFTVVLGTLFPLIAEATRGIKVSVGGPFFNRMTMPLAVTLLFLLGVGPALPWGRVDRAALRRKLIAPAIAFVVALVVAILVGARQPLALLAYGFGAFAAVVNLRELFAGVPARMRAHEETPFGATWALLTANPRRFGAYVAHVGLVVAAVGIAASSTTTLEREVTLTPGSDVSVGAYTLRLDRVWGQEEPNRFAVGADMTVLKAGQPTDRLAPRLNFYGTREEPIPAPSVRTGLVRDVYVNLLAFQRDGTNATVAIFVEPLVGWIWVGGLVVALGALLSVIPPRSRRRGGPVRVRDPERLRRLVDEVDAESELVEA